MGSVKSTHRNARKRQQAHKRLIRTFPVSYAISPRRIPRKVRMWTAMQISKIIYGTGDSDPIGIVPTEVQAEFFDLIRMAGNEQRKIQGLF